MPNHQHLYSQLIDDHNSIKKDGGDVIQRAEQRLKLTENAWVALSVVIKDYKLVDTSKEISFYKDVMPLFRSHMIFHRRVFQIEIARSPGRSYPAAFWWVRVYI